MAQQKLTTKEKFEAWLTVNEKAVSLFVSLARKARNAGIGRYSIAALYEVARWHFAIENTGGTFKLNNNHKPHLARYLAQTYPDLAGFFEFRRTQGE